MPPEDQTFSNITRAVSTQPSNLWILYNLGSMIWAIAIPKQIKKCLQEVVADISICSNILIHFSRFPTFLYRYIYIYIFGFGVAIQVNASTIISLWPRQPFGGILFMLFSGCAGESPSEPSYHQKRHYFTAKISCFLGKSYAHGKTQGKSGSANQDEFPEHHWTSL